VKRLALLAVFLTLAVSAGADSFTTLDGDSYTNCIVKRVEPDGIVVSDTDGVHKLKFKNLSPDTGKKYGYDPVKAVRFSVAVSQAAINQQNEITAKLEADAKFNDQMQETLGILLSDANDEQKMRVSVLQDCVDKLKASHESYEMKKRIFDAVYDQKIFIGMPDAFVRFSWGEPTSITTTASGALGNELWSYEGADQKPAYIYFRDGIVTAMKN